MPQGSRHVARRKPRRNSPFKPRLPETDEPPSLTQLEQFSQLSLRRWSAFGKALTELHTVQLFALELERQRRSAALHCGGSQERRRPMQSAGMGRRPRELALRAPGSFTHAALRGQLDLVLDVGDPGALQLRSNPAGLLDARSGASVGTPARHGGATRPCADASGLQR